MKKVLLFVAALLTAWVLTPYTASAQEYTSEAEALASANASDYEIQGEYFVPGDGRAFQVIAKGNGQFRVIGYPGGLPGNGWDRTMARFFGDGEMKDGKLVVVGEKMNIPSREEPNIIFNDEQKKRLLAGYKEGDEYFLIYKDKTSPMEKVRRESPTLGQPAPEGAFVIFDGSNLDNFLEGAKMNEEAKTLWSEATTVPFEKDRPYLLHLEFLTSFMPNSEGQARSNSGVYIAQSYECQVLDSFGLEGENNECGGFYQAERPLVNMCLPPLTWQTYDFEFTPAKYEEGKKVANARVSVAHNGVLIQDDLELKDATPGCLPEADEARGLFLQGHGNKVQYRNIWLEYLD
ncbi:MAG: DUF1080 domain-containing protein [Planctomycetia bacterium]|nr:DUF1080 domain-containing protein [Planctomycetia bacterium]